MTPPRFVPKRKSRNPLREEAQAKGNELGAATLGVKRARDPGLPLLIVKRTAKREQHI